MSGECRSPRTRSSGRAPSVSCLTACTIRSSCRPRWVWPRPGFSPASASRWPWPPRARRQGVGQSGAQGKGVADRTRPHWIRPATPFWFPWCAGRGSRGVPPPGVEPGAVKGEKTTVPVGLGRVREGKDLGAPVGPCGGSWGTVRRTGPGSGSSDHSSEPSVSAGAFASRRRDAISRAAPPPSTTTAASAISAMPAPVWARVLR